MLMKRKSGGGMTMSENDTIHNENEKWLMISFGPGPWEAAALSRKNL